MEHLLNNQPSNNNDNHRLINSKGSLVCGSNYIKMFHFLSRKLNSNRFSIINFDQFKIGRYELLHLAFE